MPRRLFFVLALPMLIISGCAMTEIAQDQFVSIKNYTVGEFYLDNGKYRDGIAHFQQETFENPSDPKAFYYLGRCYLAEDKNREGLAALKKAVRLDSGHADSHFWLGVAYAANGNPKAERKSYETTLAMEPDHVQALVYLGHNRFEAKSYGRALMYYNRALAEVPDEPQALYNRGLICRRYRRTPEEIQSWRVYLENYPQGAHARQAAKYLNMYGLFDYRNHLIGIRSVTLGKIKFEPLTAKLDKASRNTLDFLANVFEKQTRFELHVLVYQKNNKALAKSRARSIRRYLTERHRRISSSRIKISWFDVPEKVVVGKKRFHEDAAINFFTLRRKT